ncbi:MAG: hypothetical protein WCX73_01995 [Candidatus Pacearchaeota archaeon]|jgi:hypothetical protein
MKKINIEGVVNGNIEQYRSEIRIPFISQSIERSGEISDSDFHAIDPSRVTEIRLKNPILNQVNLTVGTNIRATYNLNDKSKKISTSPLSFLYADSISILTNSEEVAVFYSYYQ